MNCSTPGFPVHHQLPLWKFIPMKCFENSKSGVPNFQAKDQYLLSDQQGVILEMKCIINRKLLNHLKTIPLPWSMEKVSSTKLIPGAKKVGDYCSKGLFKKCVWR